MDALTVIMEELKMRRSIHMQADFRAPWSIEIDPESFASFHFVYQGSCYMKYGPQGFVHMNEGDLIVFPKGSARTLSSDPSIPPVPMSQLLPPITPDTMYFPVKHGGDGELTRLWGGGLLLQEPYENPVLQALPHALLIRAEELDASKWFASHLRCIFDEGISQRPGCGVIISKMSEVILLHAIRSYLEKLPEGASGFLQAVQDRRLSPVILALHQKPNQSWTVESLANLANMSRASFAKLFPKIMGKTPMRCLTEIRLNKGAKLLRTSTMSVLEIALEIGYQSQPPFSTAFRNHFNHSPREYRNIHKHRIR